MTSFSTLPSSSGSAQTTAQQHPAVSDKKPAVRRLLQQCWRWCCRVALVQPSFLSYHEPLIRLVQPTFRAHLSHARPVLVQQQGNFVHLTLKAGYRWRGFVPGQHLQLVLEINGRAVSRTFSISSSLQQFLQQGLIRLTIQQQPGGLITGNLLQLLQLSVPETVPETFAAGNYVTQHATPKQPVPIYISAATGDFVLQQQQPILLLAAGSGITPIHAMLTSITRLTQPLLLIYSFRGADQLLFADSWLALQQRFPLLQVQLIDTSSRNRLQPAEVEHWLQLQPRSMVYLCGPTLFSRHWQQQLTLLGVSASAIKQESFGLASPQSPGGESRVYNVTAKQAGRTITLQSTEGSLLKSLEVAGLNPRYGCRRGICMQCLCQKSQGMVQNLVTGEISDAGPGLIQLCISQPMSAVELKLA